MFTKLLHSHRNGCRALGYVADGSWSTPWSYLREHKDRRDRIGRRHRHGMTRWLETPCNTLDCHGLLIVREGDIMAELPHSHPAPDREGSDGR